MNYTKNPLKITRYKKKNVLLELEVVTRGIPFRIFYEPRL